MNKNNEYKSQKFGQQGELALQQERPDAADQGQDFCAISKLR